MGKYCIYLRKSRKDLEAEKGGEGETLKRHEDMLFKLAIKMGIVIEDDAIYREIVSGETIASRPEMQRLLADIELGMWDGVLVAEVERLARGDTIDQGIVAQVFKLSNTKIITPTKSYDPSNEYDEEYFEFGLFMSRREYKKINQRMNNGRIASVNEGKYVGNVTPYGFVKEKLKGEKGFILVPVEHELEAVELIFNLYAYENKSLDEIAKQLDQLNVKPRIREKWSKASISDILDNPAYIGKIKWKGRKQVKKTVNGAIKITRPRNKDDVILTKGRHEPIINMETWDIVQEKRKINSSKVCKSYTLQNPLAGIVKCEKCGSNMKRRPYPDMEAFLICDNPDCDNVSSKLSIVEAKLLETLKYWLQDFKVEYNGGRSEIEFDYINKSKSALIELEKELSQEEDRFNRACIAFEDGTYTKEVFIQRSKALKQNIEEKKRRIAELKKAIDEESEKIQNADEIIPRIENIMSLYESDISNEQKNQLLKTILEKVTYLKTERAKRGEIGDNFELRLFPKVLKK